MVYVAFCGAIYGEKRRNMRNSYLLQVPVILKHGALVADVPVITAVAAKGFAYCDLEYALFIVRPFAKSCPPQSADKPGVGFNNAYINLEKPSSSGSGPVSRSKMAFVINGKIKSFSSLKSPESLDDTALEAVSSKLADHDVFAPSVRYKIHIYNSGFTGVSPCAYRYFYGNYPIPKKRSKKPSSFAITPCFFSARFPPPKRDMGGSSLSMSVPVVLTAPSRNDISIN